MKDDETYTLQLGKNLYQGRTKVEEALKSMVGVPTGSDLFNELYLGVFETGERRWV